MMAFFAAILILASATGANDAPGPKRGELAGVWRLADIEFAGLERAVVEFYVESGINRDDAARIARGQFAKLTPKGIAEGRTAMRLERTGRYSDNAGGSGTWAVEKGKILVIGTGSDRFTASSSLAGDRLILAVGKAQFLSVMARKSSQVDSAAYALYRRILPERDDVMRLIYERVKTAPGAPQSVRKR